MNNTKEIFVVFTNTDLTEGRGHQVPVAVCEKEITAIRRARGNGVQGSDGEVRRMELIEMNGRWYVPVAAITITPATREDESAQKLLDNKRAIMEKAAAAGLTSDDIKILTS